jgi:Cu(I)/Ag(I) efflux system membrane fusion protein
MKNIHHKKSYWLIGFCIMLFVFACTNKTNNAESKSVEAPIHSDVFTCSMHPEIIRDKPGDCPICGMTLIKKVVTAKRLDSIGLETLLKPTDKFVISSIPLISMTNEVEDITIDALGSTTYNTNFTGSISARFSGRIEKLYLKYNFQDVMKGQKVMDIYSPELQTAQENLIFILENDPSNTSLISAAKQKLLLLGFPESSLQYLIKTKKTKFTVPVFSNYDGHIHDMGEMKQPLDNDPQAITPQLMVKEGTYVTKGQTLFKVFNPHHLWVLLNIYPGQQSLVKTGQKVALISEDYPNQIFNGNVDYIEPIFREGSKTLTVRVNLKNKQGVHIPVGVQMSGQIITHKDANWVPIDAVLSLGMGNVVFIKDGDKFKVKKIETGYKTSNKIEIISGLNSTDSIANNAQFLMDSEGFIKIN